MKTSKPVQRLWWFLSLSLFLLGLGGCAAAPFDLSVETMFTPAVPNQAPPAKPMIREPKPTDAEADSDLRHPYRWRKKLRAKYA